jgi:hypothetical protein
MEFRNPYMAKDAIYLSNIGTRPQLLAMGGKGKMEATMLM